VTQRSDPEIPDGHGNGKAGGLRLAFELWVAHPSAVWKGGDFAFRCATVHATTDGENLIYLAEQLP